MLEKTRYRKNVVEKIKHQVRVLNGIVLLIVYAILFLILKFLSVLLDYVSTTSLVAILTIVAGLVVTGMYLSNSAARSAIKTIEEYNNKFTALLKITNSIRETVYGDVLLENIIDGALKITGAESGSILLVENEKLAFKIVKGNASNKLIGLSVPKTHGIPGWVYNHGSIARINDVIKDGRFDPEMDKITGCDTKSVLCVPLRLSSGIIGVLELINKNDGFGSDDEDLISFFADQAAIAISRAKFYEDQKNYEIHLTDILLDVMDSYIHEKSGHSKRVAKYCLLMARTINMSEDEKKKLYQACLLHDIGFLKIDLKNISSKNEYRKHSKIAFDMLHPINFYADLAPLILHHHERYDGKGYPAGLKGEDIPLESRMIAIAEAFDAMVNRDSYRYAEQTSQRFPPHNFKSTLEELQKNAGTQFDPELVGLFVKNIGEDYLEEA